MSLNSTVTPTGAEIGRAQAMQAAACGIEPEAAMNPVLIKPSGDRKSQVLVMGKPYADATARSYQELKHELRAPVVAALDDLRARFDVVVCEGAGSPAEINLRQGDLANMGLARAANLPVLVIGDIDRGGVFPSLYGTLALLEPEDQALIAGFLINKFRGDPSILDPGLDMLRNLTGRHTYGVLPWLDGPFIDAEDSLALRQDHTTAGHAGRRGDPPALDEQLHRRRCARGRAGRVASATRARRPTSSAPTSSSSPGRRPPSRTSSASAPTASTSRCIAAQGPDPRHLRRLPDARPPDRGRDRVRRQRDRPRPAADSTPPSRPRSCCAGSNGTVLGVPATGYEIRHGRVDRDEPLIQDGDVLGTAWHGLLEGDEVRRKLLSWVAERTGRTWTPGTRAFQAVREAHLDRLADWFGAHVDAPAFTDLIQQGAPEGLPTIPPGGTACSVF